MKYLLDEGMTLKFISPAQISPLNFLFGAPPNLLCLKWTTNLPLQIYCFHRFVNFSFFFNLLKLKVQFSSVTWSCPTLCDPMDCSMPGLPVHHQLMELTQTHVHQVGNAVQLSHLSSSSPVFNLFHQQGLFNESVLRIRWPKYWSFSFSIILPMNIHDWFLLGCTGWISLQSQGLSSLLQHHSSKA